MHPSFTLFSEPGELDVYFEISAYYHDSAACLLKDSAIVPREERFTRIKHDSSFQKCDRLLHKEGVIKANDLEAVVFFENHFLNLNDSWKLT